MGRMEKHFLGGRPICSLNTFSAIYKPENGRFNSFSFLLSALVNKVTKREPGFNQWFPKGG